MAEDLLAFSADGPWQSWQMAKDLLAFSADGRGFVGILGRWSLAILADGRGFVGILGRWSRVSWHMVQGFLANGPGFLGKWPKICPLQLHSPHLLSLGTKGLPPQKEERISTS